MNSRERVLAALRIEQPDRIPFVESGVDPPIQRALLGKDEFLPEELNEVMGLDNLPVKFFPPIIAEYEEHGGIDFIARPLLRTRHDLDKMVLPDPEDPALYAEAEELIRRNQGRYAVSAHTRLGASATHMSMGLDGLAYALADDPGLVDTVLGRYADWTIAVVRHLKDVGVDLVWTHDDLAHKTGPFFSPRLLRGVFMPHLHRVADAIRSEGLPWIFHSDGNLMPILDELLTLGFDGLHLLPLHLLPHNVRQPHRRHLWFYILVRRPSVRGFSLPCNHPRPPAKLAVSLPYSIACVLVPWRGVAPAGCPATA